MRPCCSRHKAFVGCKTRRRAGPFACLHCSFALQVVARAPGALLVHVSKSKGIVPVAALVMRTAATQVKKWQGSARSGKKVYSKERCCTRHDSDTIHDFAHAMLRAFK